MGSRIAAAGGLAISVATLVVLIVFTARDLLYLLASLAAGALGISALWIAATNRCSYVCQDPILMAFKVFRRRAVSSWRSSTL